MRNVTVKSDPEKALLKMFLRGRPKATLEAYKTDLEAFNGYIGGSSVPQTVHALLNSPSGKANAIVYAYRMQMEEQGLSPSTINRRLSALRSLTKFGRQFGLINWKIEIENVRAASYRDTRGPGRERVYLLIEALRKQGSPKAKRDLAIVMLMYSLALRASEVIGVDLEDMDFESKQVWIKGKGRKEKELMSVPESTLESIRDWLEVRGQNAGPLFVNFDRSSKEQSRLTRSGLFKVIRRLGVKTGLSVQLRPHGFRHTAVTEAVKSAQQAGITLNEVLQFSRHTSLQVLQVYADRERDVQGTLSQLVVGTL